MKVSIQIPTYNQEGSIDQAIQSALDQDYDNFEIVVLDDCSNDRTYEIASKSKSEKVRVFKNENNLGRAATYHKLLYELVQGEWVVNLDGDDLFIDATFISKAVEQLQKYPELVFYQACTIGNSKHHQYHFRHKLLQDQTEGIVSGDFYFIHFHRNQFFGHLSTVYNAELAKKIGFYEKNNLNTDAESILKLALMGNIYLDNKAVGYWNIHENNQSNLGVKKQEETLLAFLRLKDYATPFIGAKAAQKWYKEALKVNEESFMEQLCIQDFPLFLKESFNRKYFRIKFFKLFIKKILGRV